MLTFCFADFQKIYSQSTEFNNLRKKDRMKNGKDHFFVIYLFLFFGYDKNPIHQIQYLTF